MAQSFYACFFINPSPNTCGTRYKASVSKRKSPFFLRRQDPTHWLFSNLPKSSAHASGEWRHSHPQVLSGIFILTSLNDTSSPAEAWTHALMLHLTNPCAKWKVLRLTKQKGRIYKTKPLGHYITSGISDIPPILNYRSVSPIVLPFSRRWNQCILSYIDRASRSYLPNITACMIIYMIIKW